MSEITNIPIHKRRIIIVASDDDQLKKRLTGPSF